MFEFLFVQHFVNIDKTKLRKKTHIYRNLLVFEYLRTQNSSFETQIRHITERTKTIFFLLILCLLDAWNRYIIFPMYKKRLSIYDILSVLKYSKTVPYYNMVKLVFNWQHFCIWRVYIVTFSENFFYMVEKKNYGYISEKLNCKPDLFQISFRTRYTWEM